MFQNILQQAVKHTAGLEKASIANLGSAMKSMDLEGNAGNIFRGIELEENSIGMKMHTALKQGAERGMFYDEDTMKGMLTNLQEGRETFVGLNVGSMSGSNFLNNVAGQGSGLGQATAMIGLGAMAGTANMIAGGDFSEGAVVGALGGATVAGFARSIAKSGNQITDDMLKKTLGDSYKKATTEEVGTSAAVDVRKVNMKAFKEASEDQLSKANLTVAQRDAMFETDPSKKTNVAMRNRMLTVGGGMLSGVAFTSNKRDYRRGFNKSRGNRI